MRQGDGLGVSEGGAGGGEQVELGLDVGELGGLQQDVERLGHLGAAAKDLRTLADEAG